MKKAKASFPAIDPPSLYIYKGPSHGRLQSESIQCPNDGARGTTIFHFLVAFFLFPVDQKCPPPLILHQIDPFLLPKKRLLPLQPIAIDWQYLFVFTLMYRYKFHCCRGLFKIIHFGPMGKKSKIIVHYYDDNFY